MEEKKNLTYVTGARIPIVFGNEIITIVKKVKQSFLFVERQTDCWFGVGDQYVYIAILFKQIQWSVWQWRWPRTIIRAVEPCNESTSRINFSGIKRIYVVYWILLNWAGIANKFGHWRDSIPFDDYESAINANHKLILTTFDREQEWWIRITALNASGIEDSLLIIISEQALIDYDTQTNIV